MERPKPSTGQHTSAGSPISHKQREAAKQSRHSPESIFKVVGLVLSAQGQENLSKSAVSKAAAKVSNEALKLPVSSCISHRRQSRNIAMQAPPGFEVPELRADAGLNPDAHEFTPTTRPYPGGLHWGNTPRHWENTAG